MSFKEFIRTHHGAMPTITPYGTRRTIALVPGSAKDGTLPWIVEILPATSRRPRAAVGTSKPNEYSLGAAASSDSYLANSSALASTTSAALRKMAYKVMGKRISIRLRKHWSSLAYSNRYRCSIFCGTIETQGKTVSLCKESNGACAVADKGSKGRYCPWGRVLPISIRTCLVYVFVAAHAG